MAPTAFRDDLAPVVAWAAAGGCWTVQLFLPWTTAGLLSASSPVEGFRLVRSGAVDAVVPGWSAWVLLALPAVGLALLALAAFAGRAAAVTRVVLALVGAVAVAAGVAVLVGAEPARLGAGGWTAVAGAAAALAGALLDRATARRHPPAGLATRPS